MAGSAETGKAASGRPAAAASSEPLGTISQLPAGHFVKMALHAQAAPIAGVPPGGPFILVWGTGSYRKSDAYFSIVPVAQFETGRGTLYFSGFNPVNEPQWSEKETDAKAIVQNGTMGGLSVTWCKDLGLWLMTYDSRPPAAAGIEFSYSKTTWGPWSEPQIIFNAVRDGAAGKFIHLPGSNLLMGNIGSHFGGHQSKHQKWL